MPEENRQSLADVGLTPAGRAADGLPELDREPQTGGQPDSEPAPSAPRAGGRSDAAPQAAPSADAPQPAADGQPKLAIAAIVVAAIGFLVGGIVLGPVAVVLAVVARRRRPTMLSTIAIVVGVLAFVVSLVILLAT